MRRMYSHELVFGMTWRKSESVDPQSFRVWCWDFSHSHLWSCTMPV